MNIKISGPVYFKQFKINNTILNFFGDKHLYNYKGGCVDETTNKNTIPITKLLINISKKENIKLLVECFDNNEYNNIKDYMFDLCKYNVMKIDIRNKHDIDLKKKYYNFFVYGYQLLVKHRGPLDNDKFMFSTRLTYGIEMNNYNNKYIKKKIKYIKQTSRLDKLIKERNKITNNSLKYKQEFDINSEILNVYSLDIILGLIKKKEKKIFIYMGYNHTNKIIEYLKKISKKNMSLTATSFNENNRCITISNLNQLTNLSLNQIKSNIGGYKRHKYKKLNNEWDPLPKHVVENFNMPGY